MYIWNSFTFNGMSVLLFKTICPRKFNGGNQNLHMILNSGKKIIIIQIKMIRKPEN